MAWGSSGAERAPHPGTLSRLAGPVPVAGHFCSCSSASRRSSPRIAARVATTQHFRPSSTPDSRSAGASQDNSEGAGKAPARAEPSAPRRRQSPFPAVAVPSAADEPSRFAPVEDLVQELLAGGLVAKRGDRTR
jgi:hypothetical protein